MAEIQENNKNEMMDQKKNIRALTIVAVVAIAGMFLYYFFLYQPKEPQYQTFSFVSGDVVGKDDAEKTITVMADEGQLIPPGIRKTFYIADKAIIQRIIRPETENQNQTAVFKEADFNDIQIGDGVVVQGEFTTDTSAEEKRATSVSILSPGSLTQKAAKSTPTELSKTPLSTLSGIVKEKNADGFVIEQADTITTEEDQTYQTHPVTIKIDEGTFFKITVISNNAIRSIDNSSFKDLKNGDNIVVELNENRKTGEVETTAKVVNIINNSPSN